MNSHAWRPCTKYSYRAELQFLPIPQMLQWRFIPPPTWICWVRQQLISLTPHATTVRKFRNSARHSSQKGCSLSCLSLWTWILQPHLKVKFWACNIRAGHHKFLPTNLWFTAESGRFLYQSSPKPRPRCFNLGFKYQRLTTEQNNEENHRISTSWSLSVKIAVQVTT